MVVDQLREITIPVESRSSLSTILCSGIMVICIAAPSNAETIPKRFPTRYAAEAPDRPNQFDNEMREDLLS